MAIDLFTILKYPLKPLFKGLLILIGKFINPIYTSWIVAAVALLLAFLVVWAFSRSKITKAVTIIILTVFIYLAIMGVAE